jgi:hypothetical protein
LAALLTEEWINKEFGHRETLDEALIERGAKAISESDPGRFAEFVEMIVIDKSKHAALYSDGWSADLDPAFARGCSNAARYGRQGIGSDYSGPERSEGAIWRDDAPCAASRLGSRCAMIRIAISEAAFQAIASTKPLRSGGYQAEVGANGERLIWLLLAVVDRLKALRGPGETSSEAILRLAKEG